MNLGMRLVSRKDIVLIRERDRRRAGTPGSVSGHSDDDEDRQHASDQQAYRKRPSALRADERDQSRGLGQQNAERKQPELPATSWSGRTPIR